MYRGIKSIGPGRYKEIPAMISSIFCGFSSFINDGLSHNPLPPAQRTVSNGGRDCFPYLWLVQDVYKRQKLLCGKFPFMAGKDFTPELGKVLNSKKVSDHHAIIPTMELAKTDLAALPESERNILTLSGARLLMATAAPHTFEAVTAVFECAGQSFTCLLYTSHRPVFRKRNHRICSKKP